MDVLLGIGILAYQVDKSLKIDEQGMRRNIKAFTITAEAQRKLEKANNRLMEVLTVNAKRKQGLLICHFKLFQEQYSQIRKIQFKKGKGIEELEKIERIQEQIHQYLTLPSVSTGKMMTDKQLLINVAIKGIGGYIVQDSKNNLSLAKANMAQANAVLAQADSICIALEGIATHTEIVTGLLEKLGLLYIKSINNITKIFEKNGMNADNYSDQDIEAINMSLVITKLIYRVINTPLINPEGKIEQESVKVINEGQLLLSKIEGGV